VPRLIERNPAAYELLMRVRHGRQFSERMRTVAAEVPPASAVVELCCGAGTLYTHYLRGNVSSYIGLDVNERFVAMLRRRGIDARPMDLSDSHEPIPSGDVLIIQGAMHEFLPDADHILNRMLAAARRLVVVSEPILAPVSSPSAWRRLIPTYSRRRFTEKALDELFEPCRELLLKTTLLAGGCEKLYVLQAG
jgi:trans-aconitate methyltransferase